MNACPRVRLGRGAIDGLVGQLVRMSMSVKIRAVAVRVSTASRIVPVSHMLQMRSAPCDTSSDQTAQNGCRHP